MSKSSEFQERPAILIGGTGAGGWDSRPLYRGIAAKPIALPGRGLGKVEDTYEQLRDKILTKLDGIDGPVTLGGYSQGGVHALKLSLDSELKERVVNTITVASPSRGFSADSSEHPLGTKLAKTIFRNPPAVEGMLETSDFMMELTEEIKTEWSNEAKLTALVPAGDHIVPTSIQLGLELPFGQEAHEILLGTHGEVKRALARAAAVGLATENIEVMYGHFPADHLLAVRSFRNIINKVIQQDPSELSANNLTSIHVGTTIQTAGWNAGIAASPQG